MADENNEDDSWLYGSSNENQENPNKSIDEATTANDTTDGSIDPRRDIVSYFLKERFHFILPKGSSEIIHIILCRLLRV